MFFSVTVNTLLFSILLGWIGWDGNMLTSSNACTYRLGHWKVGITGTGIGELK